MNMGYSQMPRDECSSHREAESVRKPWMDRAVFDIHSCIKQVKNTATYLKLRDLKLKLNHSNTEKHAGGVCYVRVFQTCRLLLLFQIIASFDGAHAGAAMNYAENDIGNGTTRN